ncbi:MAG: Hsp20/alpha crystallin family protein [Taibaiella sp.]|nr:Hsp20/alpha crystallin family protein [Taibaiella sp.]
MANQSLAKSVFPSRGLWKNFFDDSFFNRYMDKFWDTASPAINIAESDKQYTVDMVVPGFSKEDIRIDVKDNILSISAEAKKETSEEDKEYTRKEYNFSSFNHSFSLPEDVQDDAITAEYKGGVLKLALPKSGKQVTASKKIDIQ